MDVVNHDCLFVVVEEGSRFQDYLFRAIYPIKFRIKRFVPMIILALNRCWKRRRRLKKNLI